MEVLLLTRRRFLQASGAMIAAATTGLWFYTWRVEPHWLEFVYRSLPIRGLPASLQGRTLVQLSDIHVGGRVDDEYVIDAFRRVAALRPDIVVVTGDLISYHGSIFEQMASVYRHFPRGRLATLAILGNHDYGPEWAHPEIAAQVVETVAAFGITVLRNQVHEVGGLRVVGLDDLWAKRFDTRQVVPLLKSVAECAVVLSHNPDTVDLPVWDSYEGWILSGHTHGGQCKPPFLRPPLLPCRNARYTAGEFDLSAGRRMYISRGVGHLLHVRFNVRPEVTIFDAGA
jgi:predicted MPP superfamily phosphohydrolase